MKKAEMPSTQARPAGLTVRPDTNVPGKTPLKGLTVADDAGLANNVATPDVG